MATVHHSAIVARDVETSLRFWRDGLGFTVLMDEVFAGGWGELFDAPTDRLRAVFLGDPARPDVGIVELVQFVDDADQPLAADPGAARPPSGAGFFLLSVITDLAAALGRFDQLGLDVDARVARVAGVAMAVVRDPDGVAVELVDSAGTANLDRLVGEG